MIYSSVLNTLAHVSESQSSWREAASGVSGSISISCWIVLLVPQLVEQWRLKSSEGIALGFIVIWALGDMFNCIGAIWAGLLPQVIILGIWFCFADFLMISSYLYYTKLYPKHHLITSHALEHHAEAIIDESSPILGTRDAERSRSERSRSKSRSRRKSSTITDIAVEPELHSIFSKYVFPILIVIASGAIGYFFSGKTEQGSGPQKDVMIGPQIFGYISALLYLGARIPQIIRNHKRRSVEGLSLLFFLFSTMGNLAYASQILFYRSDKAYIILNLSWLLGSLGTIFEDLFIFFQFYVYRGSDAEINNRLI